MLELEYGLNLKVGSRRASSGTSQRQTTSFAVRLVLSMIRRRRSVGESEGHHAVSKPRKKVANPIQIAHHAGTIGITNHLVRNHTPTTLFQLAPTSTLRPPSVSPTMTMKNARTFISTGSGPSLETLEKLSQCYPFVRQGCCQLLWFLNSC